MFSPIRLGAALIACLICAPIAAQADNALPFSRSYLVTGNYAVLGVDLLPQSADCTTWGPDCYVKADITVPTCPATGAQPGQCIPAGADVLAAFMYWETISSNPAAVPVARLRGLPVTKASRTDLPLPSQGSCLSSNGSQLTLSMFSADVLRLFPIENDSAGKSTGRRLVTGTQQIALAEIGNGNNAKQSAGASIFFVYRVPTEPLRKVVVYDGVYLQYPAGSVMQQRLQGFYQSWDGHQSAWLTHIVGSGAKNTTARLKFNDTVTATDVIATDPFPFPLGGAGGNGSDRAWANPTFDVTSKMNQTATAAVSGFGETATTAVDHANNSPYECLSWAAVIFSTTVKDADHDGLPDGLEDVSAGLKDPSPNDLLNTANPAGRSLPNLKAMGASSAQRDVFLEVNGMWAPAGTQYGDATAPFSTILNIPSVTAAAEHLHLPTPDVVKLLGDALKAAPSPVALHVDVGSIGTYKGRTGYNSDVADEYLVCTHDPSTKLCTGSSADARGGEIIQETYCDPNLQTNDPTQPNSLGCHFPKFPGTVGWKFGFEHYRDQAVDGADGHELSAADENDCYADGTYGAGATACRRRFDPIRTGLFHYFLYAHALGVPKGKPCLDAANKDADFNGTDGSGKGICGSPLTNNPNFHVPKSTSGAGDAPGGGAVISVGLWDLVNFVSSPFLQASTSLHELGHNFDLSHGGKPPTFGNATTPTSFEVNCKPNYPSIMSYLFQVNGLLDLDGNAHIDYSRAAYYDTGNIDHVLNESVLYDGFLPLPDASQNPAFRYRTAWYTPVIAPVLDGSGNVVTPGNLAYALGVQPAARYCTGARFGDPAPSPSMGRIDGPGLGPAPDLRALIDWDLNASTSTASLDVNFDGTPNGSYQGYNDWASIRLDQIGAGGNPAGFSLGQGGFEFGQGGFEFGQGGFEFGQGGFDFGQGGFEFGQGGFEFGQGGFEFGQGGFDFGDGAFNFGQGGFEFGQGGFEFGQGGFDFGQGGFDYGNDVDFDHVKRNGNTPPLSVKAIVRQSGPNLHRNEVSLKAPNVGAAFKYVFYRALGSTVNSSVEQLCVAAITPVTPLRPSTPGNPVPNCNASTTFVDTEELPYNQQFTYFARAIFSDCNPAVIATCQSGPSNLSTVDPTVNSAPIAVADPTYTVVQNKALDVPAPGVLGNDTDEDSPASILKVAVITATPAHGTLVLNPNGSFTYTPQNGYTGTDAFKYRLDDGKWRSTNISMSALSNEVTVTITVTKKK